MTLLLSAFLLISNPTGKLETISEASHSTHLIAYADQKTQSCFGGDIEVLADKINQNIFNDGDWGISDANVLNNDLIEFTFWDLGGITNTFHVGRCEVK